MVNHVLMAEALRRTDPKRRSYRQMVQEDLLTPLRMHDTSVGLRADLKPRKVVPDFRGNYPIGHRGHSDYGPNGAFEEEHAEMPWVGIASTVPDMFRFAEALRLGGALDGSRFISPATLKLACQNWTGDKSNELYTARGKDFGIPEVPGYIGLVSRCAARRSSTTCSARSPRPARSATTAPALPSGGLTRSATSASRASAPD